MGSEMCIRDRIGGETLEMHKAANRATVKTLRQTLACTSKGDRMPRPALYSSSRHARPQPAAVPAADAAAPLTAGPATPASASTPPSAVSKHSLRALWTAIVVLTALLLTSLWLLQRPAARKITQDDIDAAVLRTLETNTLPSAAARAVETVAPSVVRVVGYSSNSTGKKEVGRSVGTGVVIVDKGIILTCLLYTSPSPRDLSTSRMPSSA